MFDRNQLAHLAIWPREKNSRITVLDGDGVVYASSRIDAPMRGSDIAKLLPPRFFVDLGDCAAFSMSGDVLIRTVAPFDTTVVTEKAVISFDERMARLERREYRREKRQERLENENKRLRDEIEAARVIDPEPAAEPAPEPVPEPAPEVDAVPGAEPTPEKVADNEG